MMKTKITITSATIPMNPSQETLVVGVHPESEYLEIADDEARDERSEVAATPRSVDREVARRDDQHHGDRRRLAPDAEAPVRDHDRKHESDRDADRGRDADRLDELDERPAERPAVDDDGREAQSEGSARGIVQRGLGHDRLGHLRSHVDRPREQRDQDRRDRSERAPPR